MQLYSVHDSFPLSVLWMNIDQWWKLKTGLIISDNECVSVGTVVSNFTGKKSRNMHIQQDFNSKMSVKENYKCASVDQWKCFFFLDFKLSPCSKCCMLSSGLFSGV